MFGLSDYAIAIIGFVVIVVGTFGITGWASMRNKSTSDHYVAGSKLTGWQNGLAISGDYLSAASFLGIAGAIALQGFAGFYLSIGFLVAYLVVLLLVAEPLRNLGKFTLADMLTTRFNMSRIRSVAAINVLGISLFYMVAQLVGAGAIIKLLVGWPYWISVIGIGILMTFYIVMGGMIATTWIQIVKAVLLISGSLLLALFVLAQFSFNPIALMGTAAEELGAAALQPAAAPTLGASLDILSLNIALILGTAGLPHILIRFFTVPDARTARHSIVWATWIIGLFYLITPILGYGAAIFVGREAIAAQDAEGNMAAPQLAQVLGGPLLFAFVSAVAFATIVAVVAGLVIAASSAFGHDFYTNVFRGGEASDQEQRRAARIAAVGVSAGAIGLSLPLEGQNVAFLVALAFGVAASANVPVLLLTVFWSRLNTTGAVSGMIVGLVSSIGLIVLSPVIMGEAAIFPFERGSPALISVPLGFLACYVGTLLGGRGAERERERGQQTDYDEVYVRSLTGLRKEEVEQ